MSTLPAPQVTRGEILLQPSFFTSSLFVDPLRDDIRTLLRTFTEAYSHNHSSSFQTFKAIWTDSGWHFLHLKVYDARTRDTFLRVVFMLFVERLKEEKPLVERVAALFGLYIFHQAQPSTSLRKADHIDIPINIYMALLGLPAKLVLPELTHLRPYTIYVLKTLLQAQVFHILPHSALNPGNPSRLPREYVITDELQTSNITQEREVSTPNDGSDAPLAGAPSAKKKGRPTKRDKAKKAKDAFGALDRWLDKSAFTYVVPSTSTNEGADQTSSTRNSDGSAVRTTHTLLSHPPTASRAIYAMQKNQLLDTIGSPISNTEPSTEREEPSQLQEVLRTANTAVLARLRRIDELAAERGLEVGAEGGELTGLARVERAVSAMDEAQRLNAAGSSGNVGRGGILGLLEGAGLHKQQ